MKMAMNRKIFYGEILVIVYTAGIVLLATSASQTLAAPSIACITSSGDGDGTLFSTNQFSFSSAMTNVSSVPSTTAEMFGSGEDETTFSLEVFTDETTARDITVSSSVYATTAAAEETNLSDATPEVTKVLETDVTIEETPPILTQYTTTFAIATIETTIPITTAPLETTVAATKTPATTASTTASTSRPATSVPTIQTTPEPNPCQPNPCRNGGTCTKGSSTTYTCSCVPGYTNHSCEVEINECESFPCYGFGKCIDLVNDYECTCNPGYTRYCSNSHECIAIDFCSQSNYTCFNNGTCVNQPQYSRYYCDCPDSVDDITYYTGLDCGNTTTTSPVPEDMSPKTGILAGGARLTVTGRGLDTLVPFGAYFRSIQGQPLNELSANVDPANITATWIVIISPRATAQYANRSLEVVLNYNGPLNVTIPGRIFTYQGDPVITDIQPRDVLAVGGVNLTVTGDNMDVVANPLMDITTIVHNTTTKNSTTAIFRESCSSRDRTQMTCRIPVGIVPDAFLLNKTAVVNTKTGLALLRLSPNWHSRRRRRKREPIASLNDPETGSTFEMYLGFIFDDLPTYENTSKSLPSITLTLVITIPTIPPQDQAQDFNPETDTYAYIKGSELKKGCSITDYTVTVGNETCPVTNLTDNEITYMPPKVKPATPNCQTTEGAFTVTVKVSTVTQIAYCLRYVDGLSDPDKALIIGVSVAVGVIVILLVIIGIYVVIRRRRRKNRTPKSDSGASIASSREQNDYEEDSKSQTSVEPDYLQTLPDDNETDRRLDETGADVSNVTTFHRQGSSYYNTNIVDSDEVVRIEDDPMQRATWEYEMNDEALTFDLKQVKFNTAARQLPRVDFNVDPRQSTTSFT